MGPGRWINSLPGFRFLFKFPPQMEPKFEYKLKVPMIFRDALAARLREFPALAKNRERYLFVLHVLARELREEFRFLEITGGAVDVTSWHARLYSGYLHSALGNDYLKVVHDLEYWGFIRRSRSYFAGDGNRPGRSKACWFGPEYAGYWLGYCRSRDRRLCDENGRLHPSGKVFTVSVRSRPLLRRLKAAAEEAKARCMLDERARSCNEELSHFSIDRRAAARELRKAVSRKTGKPLGERRVAAELAKVDRFNSASESRTSLFVRRDRYGRVHTNVTQMKREVRSCMTCDGMPVADVDIKSSQSAFLVKVLRTAADDSIDLDIYASPSMVQLRRHVASLDRDRYLAECDRYTGLLSGGRFYEFLMDEMNADFDLDVDMDRSSTKEAFFRFVFGPAAVREGDEVKGAMRRVWMEHFPVLTAALDRIKEANYTALSHEMQRVESHFVFDIVIPRLRDEVGCHYCTVHDSIIVAAEYADRVKAVMDEELAGFSVPTMTVEEFGCTHLTDDERGYEEEVRSEMLGLYGDDMAGGKAGMAAG